MHRFERYVRKVWRTAASRRLATSVQFAVLGFFGVYMFSLKHQTLKPATTSFDPVVCPARDRKKTWDTGVLYFVYGIAGSQQLGNFVKQTTFSAQRMKHLNPTLKIGVWSTTPTFFGAEFDFVGKIEQRCREQTSMADTNQLYALFSI